MAEVGESGFCNMDTSVIELGAVLVEDGYGYVDPVKSRNISKDIMMQLPSNQLEKVDDVDASEVTTCRRKALKRSETRYKTMKLKRVAFNSTSLEDDVEKVYEILTSDLDVEEDEIKTNLRDLYQSLTVKRMVKAKFDIEQENRHRLDSLNCCIRFHYDIAMLWQKFKKKISDISYSLELWYALVKKIQGHSGSGVASYFIFLRWLLYLNIFNFVMSFSFIITPQIIYERLGNFSYQAQSNLFFSGYDLFTGSGWLGNSSAFYGRYTNETIEVVSGYQYNMPMAYLFTVGVAAIINLVVVAYSVTKAYQAKYVDSSGEINKVCGKVFCAWDFSIEKSDTAYLRHRLICQELKAVLSSELENKPRQSCCSLMTKFIVCFAVNSFVICSILGIGYLVYFILESKAIEVNVKVLNVMMLAITVTAISFIFHYVISYATKLEFFFSQQVQLYLLLGRVAALRIIILSVLVYFWMIVYVPGPGDTRCYESLFGEEIYRLIVVNFLMNLVFCTLFGEYLWKIISKYLCCTKDCIKLPEFDVAYNTNDLLYYQTLVWIGAFYSPMLPLLLLLILIMLFYLKFHSLISNCQPSQKLWSAAEAQTVFLVLTLTNFLLTAIAVGYTIFRIKPSSTCGPFQKHSTMYGVIAESLSQEQDILFTAVVHYAGSPGLLFTAVLSLGVSVYYARAHSLAHQKIVKRVRQQLIIESKDKAFLLQLFQSAYVEHMSRIKNFKGILESNHNLGAASDSASRTPQSACSEPQEVTNEAYRDYYTGRFDGNWPPEVAAQARYNPGYLLADVPANSSSLSNDDDELHSPKQFNFFSTSDNHNFSPPSGTRFDFNMHEKQPPSRRFKKCESPCDDSPRLVGVKRQGQLLPQPVHKQGFQYLVHGELSPPRSSALSKM